MCLHVPAHNAREGWGDALALSLQVVIQEEEDWVHQNTKCKTCLARTLYCEGEVVFFQESGQSLGDGVRGKGGVMQRYTV